MYHLREASQIPSLGVTTRGLVKQHMDEGYGFPKECFNSTTNKSKQTSFSIHLSEVQVSAKIREILPKLGQQDFDLLKMDKRKKLELVPQYQDTSIVHHKLFVKFDGERGEDWEGLTREFFCQFWQNWAQKLVGHNKMFINLVPNSLMGAEELGAIGRILVHGYILCGYLPYYINSSVLYWLLVGREPSLDFIFNEFFHSLDEGDQHLVTAALESDEISEEMKIQLGAFLATYDFGIIPNRNILMGTLRTLSRYVTIIKPYYYLQAIRIPIEKIASKLFVEPTEEEFTTMLNSLVPTGVEVVSKLKIKYSDNDMQYALEERVAVFLQTFLVSLGRNDIMSFVRFVSGCEILPASIQVEFNGESNEEMMITSAHTCSISLHISRYFLTYQSLQSVFKNLLINTRLWSNFDVV
eukprot:gene7613-8453_t